MAKFDGTRFTKAAVPKTAGALNVSNRIIGANPRKHKLTEAAGTNPSKLGGEAIKGAPTPGGPKTDVGGSSGYAQDSAPHKSLTVEYPFSVGGPGFPTPMK